MRLSLSRIVEYTVFFRKFFWHLRKGGTEQVARFVRNQRASRNSATTVSPAFSLGRLRIQRLLSKGAKDTEFLPQYMPEYIPKNCSVSFPDIQVATLCDEFSDLAWQYEFSTSPLTPDNWKEILSQRTIDFVLLESAWLGENGKWKGQLNRKQLSKDFHSLCEYCHQHGILIAFWNKEDPVHFNDFVGMASFADVIFTTAEEAVPDYQTLFPGIPVHVLQFAASKILHNPVRLPQLKKRTGVAFAGTFYRHKFFQRGKHLTTLLHGALNGCRKNDEPIFIYSRGNNKDRRYSFPDEFKDIVLGSLTYAQTLTAYRKFKVFLNCNSVTDSKTMMSRRVWELIACGTPVISTYSAANGLFEGSGLFEASSEQDAEDLTSLLLRNTELRERVVHLGQRLIWENHTYTHRAMQILRALDLEPSQSKNPAPKISIVAPTKRPEQVEFLASQIARQEFDGFEVLIGTHGFQLNSEERNAIRKSILSNSGCTSCNFIFQPAQKTLGSILNDLCDRANGQFISKFDDDDLYLPNFLRDQFNTICWSGADIVGKGTTFVHSTDSEIMLRRRPNFEHTWTHHVAGATLLFRKAVLDRINFTGKNQGEDTSFLEAALDANLSIYSGDRFNYVTIRHTKNTWNLETRDLLRNSDIESFHFTENSAEL